MWSCTARWIGMSIVLAGLAACGSSADMPDASSPWDRRELGMNDITMLLPMPKDITAPVLLRIGGDGPGQELVTPAQLASIKAPYPLDYAVHQLVGVRFDSSSLNAAAGLGSGQLRLVFQGIGPYPGMSNVPPQPHEVSDRAAHAIYRIPASEVVHMVSQLRALADIADVPVRAPLQINTAVTTMPEYQDRLRTLVTTYARPDQLMTLAIFENCCFGPGGEAWVFDGGDITATGAVGVQSDHLLVVGGQTMPPGDSPPGFQLASDRLGFQAATPEQRMPALELLARIQNPRLTTATGTRCLACHMATGLEAMDLPIAGIDPAAVAGRFSTTHDVSIEAGAAARDFFAFRGLGYLHGSTPVISQRVANETANVLEDIAARFPPAK